MKIDLADQIENILLGSIEKNIKQGNFKIKDIPKIILLIPKDKLHGDLSTNIAMQLARELRAKPLDIANFIVNNLDIQGTIVDLSLIHISEPTRLGMISYAVFCLKKK